MGPGVDGVRGGQLGRHRGGFDDEGVESVRDLLEMAGDYGQEGAAWAVCYMSGHPALQVKLVRGNLLPPLIEMVKNGTRRCKKAAERALKAMAT